MIKVQLQKQSMTLKESNKNMTRLKNQKNIKKDFKIVIRILFNNLKSIYIIKTNQIQNKYKIINKFITTFFY